MSCLLNIYDDICVVLITSSCHKKDIFALKMS